MNSMKEAFKRVGVVPDEPKGGGKVSGQRDQRRPRHGGGDPRQRREMPKFSASYFMDEATGGAGACLRTEFVAEAKMDPMAEILGNEGRPRLTSGQLRRFFNHCRDIERRLEIDGEDWSEVAARFESLSYHARNATSGKKVPREFQQFIDENVERVTSSDDSKLAFLKGFMPHFEALVGFGSAYMKDR